MPTPFQELELAQDTLRREEERYESWIRNYPDDCHSAGYFKITSELKRLSEVLAGAKRDCENHLTLLQALGDRNKGMEKRFREQLVERDACCIATGEREGFVAAHIIPLNKSELIARDMIFSPRNGVLIHKDLQGDYENQRWIFNYDDGKVTVLDPVWIHKKTILRVNVSKDAEVGPSKDFIDLHNQMAMENRKHYCPHCWKFVGAINIENHSASSCEAS